ncbi:hypothetical protein W824_04960 [Clavibacter cf. michiganensis LMG 26808]|nr:hypothetical protein W824_04960 [Clavibacter cf. michiganensis LMG 26808]
MNRDTDGDGARLARENAAGDAVIPRADVPLLGDADTYFDAVWQVQVALTPLEFALLRRPEIRRLFRIVHAGASSIYSVQTYSRLEHSLGLLAVFSVLQPQQPLLRIAALVHDVGHSPLSHSLEHAMGEDHHRVGDRIIRSLAPLLTEHGVDVDDVLASVSGRGPTPLGRPGAMQPDHLESFVRSAHVHGRSRLWPRELLGRVSIVDGQVATDRETATYLIHLAREEATRQTSPQNVAANAAVRGLAAAGLHGSTAAGTGLEAMTDDELWARLLRHPRTGAHAGLLLTTPEAWRADPDTGAPIPVPREGSAAWPSQEITRLYVEPPLVDGRPAALPDEVLRMRERLPLRYRVTGPPVP